MVTPTEPQEVEEVVQEQEVETPEVEAIETQEATDGEGAVAAEGSPSGDAPVVTDVEPSEPQAAQEPAQQPVAQIDEETQKAISELQQRREADVNREWEEAVGKKARSYERQLNDAGYMPEQSRDQARRYIQQEQRFRKQERETANMLGYVEGRQAAAVHYMKKHGLANQQMLDDLIALQRTTSPDAMEREASRMKRERALIAENARLKQGRVAPQTFDNSQGSAEVTTNQDRLLEAYIKGDRSEAAVKAAKFLTLGT
tara:strand:- start:310 stop:1083 length:774 start_codon:yes stop_codon:yes gene_type:complete